MVKKSILKFDHFWLSEFHNRLGTKIGFNSCECIEFLKLQTSTYSMFGGNAYYVAMIQHFCFF